MAVRCREEAETVLGPHFEPLADIVLTSVRFYYEFYGERAHTHESWTRCSIIRDEIRERLIAYSEATRGFEVIKDGNATYFGVHSKFTVRIKKLSDDLHANTGKTQLSFQWDHQQPVQGELFTSAETDLTHVYLGYVAVENDPSNPPVYLVCNEVDGSIKWYIPITASLPPPGATIAPITPAAPSGPETPRRVRARRDASSKKAGNE